ncbi:MAG: hypothetical protein ABI652_02025, partial [Acidobacteriota bacterium]
MPRVRVFRWAGYFLISMVGLVVLGIGVASTPSFKNWLRGLAVQQAAAAIDGEVQIGGLSGSLWHDVTLSDVVIRQGGVSMLTVRSLTAKYDALQLIRGHFDISELEIVSPAIALVEDAAGWNVSRLIRTKSAPEPSAPRAISVGRVKVSGGDVTVAALDRPVEHIAGVDLEAAVNYAPPATAVRLAKFTARDVRTGLLIANLTTNVRADDKGLSVTDLSLVTPASSLAGRASYQWATASTTLAAVDVALDVRAATVDEFRAYLPEGIASHLVFTGTLATKGPLNVLKTTWALSSAAGAVTGDVTADVSRTAQSVLPIDGVVTVDRLDLAPLSGRADLASQLTARVTLRADLNTAAPTTSHATFSVDAPEAAILGYAASNVRASGSFDAGTLRVTGDAAAYGAWASFNAAVRGVGGDGAMPISVSGRARHLDLRRLPAALTVPRLATDVSGRYALSLTSGSWRAELTAEETRVEDAVIAAGTH